MIKTLFIYSGTDRRELERMVAAGTDPDTSFFGYLYVKADPRIDASYIHIDKSTYAFVGRIVRRYRMLRILYLYLKFYQELTSADVILIATSAYFELMRLKHLGFLRKQRFVILNLDLTIKLKTRELDKALIDQAQKIICVSIAQKKFLITQGFSAEKLAFVPLGVDKDFYKPIASANEFILTIGRDIGRDFETFIEAVKISGENVVMICSHKNIEGLEIPPNLSVLFDLSYQELRKYYKEAKVFVIATKPGESLIGSDCPGQTAILDTIAYGVPVIATYMPWFEGYFEEGKHIVTVPPKDPKALSEAMKRVIDDPGFAKALSYEGRKLIEEKCNSEAMGKAIAELILSIV